MQKARAANWPHGLFFRHMTAPRPSTCRTCNTLHPHQHSSDTPDIGWSNWSNTRYLRKSLQSGCSRLRHSGAPKSKRPGRVAGITTAGQYNCQQEHQGNQQYTLHCHSRFQKAYSSAHIFTKNSAKTAAASAFRALPPVPSGERQLMRISSPSRAYSFSPG